MNSELFDKIGLGNIDPAYILIALSVLLIGTLVFSIVTAKKLKELSIKYDKFMRGKDAETLENVIYKRFDEVDKLIRENDKKTKQIADIFENSIAYIVLTILTTFIWIGGTAVLMKRKFKEIFRKK